MSDQPVKFLPTIAKEWGEFSKMAFGATKPSNVQYNEMRRAFYAGSMTMFTNLTSVTDPKQLDAYMAEIHAWGRELMAELITSAVASGDKAIVIKVKGPNA
jgi:hypothetical protein